ncbi:hypothetical protein [Rufibacter latericius]|nr:hypothetical protein [Rufibacter latericius]
MIAPSEMSIQVKAEYHIPKTVNLSHPGEGVNRTVEVNMVEQYAFQIN